MWPFEYALFLFHVLKHLISVENAVLVGYNNTFPTAISFPVEYVLGPFRERLPSSVGVVSAWDFRLALQLTIQIDNKTKGNMQTET